MIERIMLFKLHDPSTRDEVANLSLAMLSELENAAAIDELSVGTPADEASLKSWDLSVVIGVANLALLNTVLESSPFQAYLDGAMKERCAVIKAWSFERL